MTEAQLQSSVLELAKRLGWRTAHFRTSRTSSGGWATAVQGDGAGYPDLTLIKDFRLLYVELKAEGKYPTKEQKVWLGMLEAAGPEVYVWKPRDWLDGTVERVLREPVQEAA